MTDYVVRCGKCIQCRIVQREHWACRIMLESLSHQTSWFTTLTYDDAHLPAGGNLDKTDPQRWLKRLRKRVAPTKIRYFLCGEYGARTGRAHYHCVLFGLPEADTAAIEESWDAGFSSVSPLIPTRARYIARYVTKKAVSDSPRGDGRCPEFATMSRRPGLGAAQARKIGQELMRRVGSGAAIPSHLQFGKHRLRLDRYIINLIEQELGKTETREEVKLYRAHRSAPLVRASFDPVEAANREEALSVSYLRRENSRKI